MLRVMCGLGTSSQHILTTFLVFIKVSVCAIALAKINSQNHDILSFWIDYLQDLFVSDLNHQLHSPALNWVKPLAFWLKTISLTELVTVSTRLYSFVWPAGLHHTDSLKPKWKYVLMQVAVAPGYGPWG